jgi:hypothetical protein
MLLRGLQAMIIVALAGMMFLVATVLTALETFLRKNVKRKHV